MKRIIKLISTTLISLIILGNFTILKAANASITVSSSSNRVVVGKTFNVTIKVSSSTTLGSWEFTPSYDSSKVKLVSGETSVADVGDGKVKSKSYSYKFKAVSTGNAKITVKSYGAVGWNEAKLSTTVSSKTVNIITQSDLEASYSKNNNLKSLSVEGLTLSPKFSKNVTKYTVDAGENITKVNIKASVEDSKSSLKGTGKFEVSEGDNKFNITVTAQNGNTKTYVIIVNVNDPNPIKVTVNDKEYTVVKRESNLEKPENYEKTTVTINNEKVPAFYNEKNNYTLVGLIDSESNINLFLYNNDKFEEYKEVSLSELKISPLSIDESFKEGLQKTTISIDETLFEALKMDASGFYIIHTRNIDTGKDDYYTYDSVNNTMIRYNENDADNKKLLRKIINYKRMIALLGIETVAVIFILVCILISKVRNNKKRKIELEKEKERIKKNTRKKKKEVKKDE